MQFRANATMEARYNFNSLFFTMGRPVYLPKIAPSRGKSVT